MTINSNRGNVANVVQTQNLESKKDQNIKQPTKPNEILTNNFQNSYGVSEKEKKLIAKKEKLRKDIVFVEEIRKAYERADKKKLSKIFKIIKRNFPEKKIPYYLIAKVSDRVQENKKLRKEKRELQYKCQFLIEEINGQNGFKEKHRVSIARDDYMSKCLLELKEENNELKSFIDKNSEAVSEAFELKEQNKHLSNLFDSQCSFVEEKTKEVKQLREENTSLQQKYNEMKCGYGFMFDSSNKNKEEISALRLEKRKLEAKIRKLEAKIRKLHAKLKS